MSKNILIYNSGGGLGDSIQLFSLIQSLQNQLKDSNFFYLSAHENHFNSSLKDLNCRIDTLNLDIKYFGFRWWHLFFASKRASGKSLGKFDLIIDLQSKKIIIYWINYKSIG